MFINLTDEEIAAIGAASTSGGVLQRLSDRITELRAEQAEPGIIAYREAAEKKHLSDEGDIEVDDGALVSNSDAGAYVMAWTWVTNEQAGLEVGDEEGEKGADEPAVITTSPREMPPVVSVIWNAARAEAARRGLPNNWLHIADHLAPHYSMVNAWTIGPNFENGPCSLAYFPATDSWTRRDPSTGIDTPIQENADMVLEIFPAPAAR